MAQAKPARKLTYDDYCKTPDDQRWELINGELIMAPTPNIAHQSVSIRLLLALNGFVEGAGLGEVFHAPLDVVLSNVNVVQPDLVAEALSPSAASRDWRTKMDLLARRAGGHDS